MADRIELYTLEGIVTGRVDLAGPVRDVLETEAQLPVDHARVATLDGRRPAAPSRVTVVTDDLVVAVPDELVAGPVHAAWHAIRLEAGPWAVDGELATMPGFDPGRALTRPTGTFVLLRTVRVGLLGHDELGRASHPQALVNRYTVESVEADLMLGFFFPGARIDEKAFARPPEPPDAAPTPP